MADDSQRAVSFANDVVELVLGDRDLDTDGSESVVLFCRGGLLTLDALPQTANSLDSAATFEASNSQVLAIRIPPGTSLSDLERAAVEQALAHHGGNRTRAADDLGISVRTLQRKLKAWHSESARVGELAED
jgi:DNA-binding NtrC family response regulator